MEDFFDAVLFLEEEDLFREDRSYYGDMQDLSSKSELPEDKLKMYDGLEATRAYENREGDFVKRTFFIEEDFSKGDFTSEDYGDVQEIFINNIYGEAKEEKSTFNSIDGVYNVQNTENSNKSTVITVDARSYNTVTERVDLEGLSDYIADRLSEAVANFAEGVHYV